MKVIVNTHPEKPTLLDIQKLEEVCFESFWTVDDFKGQLEHNPFGVFFCIYQDSNLVGYCFSWEIFESCQIVRIAVHPQYRNQGIASLLLEKVEEHARGSECETFSLEVRESNQAAIGLYKKHGLTVMNIKEKYYPNHENALFMMKGL